MQEIMRIGDKFVQPTEDIKDISKAGKEIVDAAHKYTADMLAVIGKGDEYNLVVQNHEQDETMLEQDIVKAITLVETIAENYGVDAAQVAEVIKLAIEEEN